MPEPLLPVAIVAKSKADEDKLSQALSRLVAEDPTLRLENNAETQAAGAVVHGRGARRRAARPARAPVRRRGGDRPLRVPLRETFAGKAAGARPATSSSPAATAQYGDLRHRGRAAAARRPGSSSSTRSSAAWCRASSSPRWRRASARRWSRASRPATRWSDIRVTLYDGKAHSVDSSDMAFQTAGRAGAAGTPRTRRSRMLLEPVDEVTRAGARRLRRRGHVRPVRRAAAGCSAPSRSASAAPWSRPRSRSSRSPGTPSTCVRCRTAPARSPAPTCATSRCPSHLAAKVAADSKPEI